MEPLFASGRERLAAIPLQVERVADGDQTAHHILHPQRLKQTRPAIGEPHKGPAPIGQRGDGVQKEVIAAKQRGRTDNRRGERAVAKHLLHLPFGAQNGVIGVRVGSQTAEVDEVVDVGPFRLFQ
jgi:hypothetical protein